MYCLNCGTPNSEGARFCANCGQALQAGEVNQYYTQPVSSTPHPVNLPWKWIGIIGGGLVVLAGLIVLIIFLVNGGFGPAAQLTRCDWYQPEQQSYLTFTRDGTLIVHDSNSSASFNYQYVLQDPDLMILSNPGTYSDSYTYRYVIDNETLILYDLSGYSSVPINWYCQDFAEPEQREK